MFTPTPPADDRPEVQPARAEPAPPPPPWMIRRSRSQVVRIVWIALLGGVVLALALGVVFGGLLHVLQPRDFAFGGDTQTLAYRILVTSASLVPFTILAVALAASTQVLTEALGRSSRRSARALARAQGRRVRRRSRLLARREWEQVTGAAENEGPDAGRPAHG
jgi:hypothetical protein